MMHFCPHCIGAAFLMLLNTTVGSGITSIGMVKELLKRWLSGRRS
jgi:hypothetical protein